MAPPASIPPALPPSVEEAYRRKCLQLKQRTKEVEDTNDAARLRLARLRRGVEKLRLERAFLLEQLAKRTSTNVEDSEGSPSPPPTPQDKPLRSKRGHRKPSLVATGAEGNGPPPTFINQSVTNLSPSSDAFSHSVTAEASQSQKDPSATASQRPNGVSKPSPSKKPTSAFELYCKDNRDTAMSSKGEGVTVEEELARGWKDLPDTQRDEYKAREKVEEEQKPEKPAEEAAEEQPEAEAETEAEAAVEAEAEAEAEEAAAQDEDVEMETED